MLRGVGFLYDRAAALGKPVVVNLSLGTDFGPHDGTMAWEKALASFVGADHPGRALVAAAGNSGSVTPGDGALVHQNVHVSKGTTMRVPIPAGAAAKGSVQVWVAFHAGASLKVGLDGPDGTWIPPIAPGSSAGKSGHLYDAAVYNGSETGSLVPPDSRGAVVLWEGTWPAGTYEVTLSGAGTVDLYLDSLGDAAGPGGNPIGFAQGVREGTINLPATHPAIIGVGCTINKPSWHSLNGPFSLHVPLLDGPGGSPDPGGATRPAIEGEPCWFSSAGPTLTGVFKPDIMAPGAAIIGALSRDAVPPAASSIFTNPGCVADGDPLCQQADALHGVSAGTSFSAPLVAGAVAVLFQHDPTLTQDGVLAALQAGAHRLRGPAPFDDQAGSGELDVPGTVEAADRLRSPVLVLPVRGESWLTLGADQLLADGSTPLQAVIELRGARAGGSPPPADGFEDGRLAAYTRVDGRPYGGALPLARRGPGVWIASVQLPAGLGGSSLTVGATFDGAPVVGEKTVPIATDAWTAVYPASVAGGCGVAPGREGAPRLPVPAGGALLGALVAGVRALRRRARPVR
jgi:hypothetical protein